MALPSGGGDGLWESLLRPVWHVLSHPTANLPSFVFALGFAGINTFALVRMAMDKCWSKMGRGRRRFAEKTLLMPGAFGGGMCVSVCVVL